MFVLKFFVQNFGILVLGALLLVLTTGCVTTHSGKEYEVAKSSLVVSCDRDHSISHAIIKSVTCTFENTGATWLMVETESIALKAQYSLVEHRVLSPNRINSFLTAYRFETEKSQHNTGLLLAGLVVGSAALSAGGHDGAAAVALGSVVLSSAYTGGNEAYYNGQGLNFRYGDLHVLGPAFELPPKSFLRKRILMESSASHERAAWPDELRLCLVQPARECADMKFFAPR